MAKRRRRWNSRGHSRNEYRIILTVTVLIFLTVVMLWDMKGG